MEAEYRKDMNHNFLILQEEEKIRTASYQVRMLIRNQIPHLLPCQLRGIDGKMMLYYEITALQPISVLYEKKNLGMKELRNIFNGFVQVLEQMEEYLLDPDSLILEPGFIYQSPREEDLFFCYFPGSSKEIWGQVQRLTEYLLPKIDHEDNEAVMLGYTVYRQAMEPDFTLELLKQTLFELQAETQEEQENLPEDRIREEREIREEEFCARWQTKKENRQIPGGIYLCILAGTAALFLILIFMKRSGYLPWMDLMMILELVLLAGTTAMAGTFFWRCYKKRKQSFVQREKKAAGREQPEETEESKEDMFQTTLLYHGEGNGASLVSSHPEKYGTICLREELVIVGKLETAADVVIPLPTISRVHAKIRKREREYYLTDLNSRNGTSINGVMINGEEEHLLKHQDEVCFADAGYIFWKP